jgi:hypothetical protein
MIGMPDCEEAFVEDAKLGYLLRPEDKGGVFLSLGFSPEEPEALRAALVEHACAARVATTQRTRFGLKFVLVGRMRSPDRRDPTMSSVWISEGDGERPRFVTAYPEDREEGR